MLPPPLTDEEVRQRVLCPLEGYLNFPLGISFEIEGMPDHSAKEETWLQVVPIVYRREWEKAYCYGLADDALARILVKLEAPDNPSTPLVQVLAKVDIPRLLETVKEMCDTKNISAWRVLHPSLQESLEFFVILLLLVISAICIIVALALLPLVAMGGILCFVLAICLSRWVEQQATRRLLERRINPQMTFQQLAECIRDTARIQAQEMQTAAQARKGQGRKR
ncbi:hypothetical protein [Armatimonas rosea]|uniref:Uncharacterized protein n=1 Tax=Armatimonas rosea TaxID=685828 RepID=A0A7W9SL25_ARMRO|nr:hypothetical protein [Armatimonas rosea]MBB6048611.1 hypothetical protein [Armatimonas rosea]